MTPQSFWRRLTRVFDLPVLLTALLLACIRSRSTRVASRTHPQRVLHVIGTERAGGAQRQLAMLLARTPRDRYRADILVLGRQGGECFGGRPPAQAESVHYLATWPNVVHSLWSIFRLCRRERYDIVHTWSGAANIVGVCAARLAGTPRIITSVRNMSPGQNRASYDRRFRVADILASRAADVVTVTAYALVADHAEWARYPAERIEVVPNGLDLETIGPVPSGARDRLRATFRLDQSAVVVGSVGRLAHENDQATFLRILARLRWAFPRIRGVIIGAGPSQSSLRVLARKLSIDHIVVFAGERADACQLMAGLDLLMLTSISEGLPNVLLEAALLNVPCIATDVGGAVEALGTSEGLFAAGNDWNGFVLAGRSLEGHGKLSQLTRTRRHVVERFNEARVTRVWRTLYGEPIDESAAATREDQAVA